MSNKIPACNERERKITRKDLPLCCPTADMVLQNGHPKIYLPIEKTKQEVCPYCGTTFILEESAS